MKKRNLTIMLALLAALALVFAAGCDTSGDSASGGSSGPYSDYSGSSYKADYQTENSKLTGTGSNGTGKLNLGEVTITFASGSGNGVTLYASWGGRNRHRQPRLHGQRGQPHRHVHGG